MGNEAQELIESLGEETNTQRRDKMSPKDLLKGLESKGLKGAKMSGNNLFIGNIESGVDLIIMSNGKWVLET